MDDNNNTIPKLTTSFNGDITMNAQMDRHEYVHQNTSLSYLQHKICNLHLIWPLIFQTNVSILRGANYSLHVSQSFSFYWFKSNLAQHTNIGSCMTTNITYRNTLIKCQLKSPPLNIYTLYLVLKKLDHASIPKVKLLFISNIKFYPVYWLIDNYALMSCNKYSMLD